MHMPEKILIIEDQKDINDLIALSLRSENYTVEQVFDGDNGLIQASKNNFELIILDVMLPGKNGLFICQHMRANDIHTPILMLTAKKSEADRVVGLEMGADDYLTKPFSVRELQARVKAMLRRASFNIKNSNDAINTADCLVFDNLLINKNKRSVEVDNKLIDLTAKEFDLLSYMAQSPGRVFNRTQLLDAVWGYQYAGYEHTVNSHINRLRSKIEADPAKPKFVLTAWGIGYKFNDN